MTIMERLQEIERLAKELQELVENEERVEIKDKEFQDIWK